jgi:uncharacterized protein (TIGR03437 family)
MAPGGLASISGIGFQSPGSQPPIVTVNSENATVLNATGFRIDFLIPPDAQPGAAVIDVISDLNGTGEQTITLNAAAPEIARIVNPDGSLNSRYKPATRGQTIVIYATGLGSTNVPLQATIGRVSVPVSAPSAASTPGLYQMTLKLPANLAPGLALPVVLQQGDAASAAGSIAVQ